MVLCTECKRCTFAKRNSEIIAICSMYNELELSAELVFCDMDCDYFEPVDAYYSERSGY